MTKLVDFSSPAQFGFWYGHLLAAITFGLGSIERTKMHTGAYVTTTRKKNVPARLTVRIKLCPNHCAISSCTC